MKDQESFYDHVRAGESKLNDLESEIMRYIIELPFAFASSVK